MTGRVRRRRTRPLLALGLGASIAAAIFVMPATALAHAGVVRTSPADGERLATSPATFEVEFSEPIGIDPSGIRVVDATGVAVDLPPARAEGALAIQALPPLPDGWYQASWSVVSSDGHIVHGAIAFAVGDATGPPPLATASDSSAAAIVVLRAIADLGLIVTVGAMAAWVMLAAVSPRVRRLATWADGPRSALGGQGQPVLGDPRGVHAAATRDGQRGPSQPQAPVPRGQRPARRRHRLLGRPHHRTAPGRGSSRTASTSAIARSRPRTAPQRA